MARLRASPPAAGCDLDLSPYVTETGLWHHQLARSKQPDGYVHTVSTEYGAQAVRGVSITGEAAAIDAAIQLLDRASFGDEYEALLLDLPRIAVAGIALIDRDDHTGSYVQVFRHPPDPSGPIPKGPMKAADFIRSILPLEATRGVVFDAGVTGTGSR